MPIVLVDRKNNIWVTEDRTSGDLIAGYKARGGQSVEDLLDFATSRDKQFEKFIQRKKQEELNIVQQQRNRILSEGRGSGSGPKEKLNT